MLFVVQLPLKCSGFKEELCTNTRDAVQSGTMDTTYEQDSEVNEEYVNMPVIRNVMMKREYGESVCRGIIYKND